MNKKILSIIILSAALIIAGIIYTEMEKDTEEKLEWLHTEGRYIKNESGDIILLRGVDVIELHSPKPFGVSRYWGVNASISSEYGYLPYSFDLLKSTGANCVRLSINWYSWRGIDDPYNIISSEQSENYKVAVDTFIEELTSRGIYVFIDFHTFGGSESPERWKSFVDDELYQYWEFWREIVERYINNPRMMGVEIINEPRSFYNFYPYEGYWWNFTLQTARIIHEVNPRLLIFIASTDNTVNGTRLGYPADGVYKVISDQFVKNPLPEHNIVYVFHHYYPMEAPNWIVYEQYSIGNLTLGRSLYEEWLFKIAFRALNADLPIMNSEFNVKHFDYRTLDELPYPYLNVTKDLLELMNDYGCHWIWWSWRGSVGYPWDFSPETIDLVYANNSSAPRWNELSDIGLIWKEYLTK